MKCIFLKLTAFAMLATASASGVHASSESDEPSSITPQSLRGSFLDENEDADWWGGWQDLTTCTSNCHCHAGESSDHCFLLFIIFPNTACKLTYDFVTFNSSAIEPICRCQRRITLQEVVTCLSVRATVNASVVRLLLMNLFSLRHSISRRIRTPPFLNDA